MAWRTLEKPVRRSRTAAPLPWHWLALGVVLGIAAFFDFYRLTANGYGNLYYAAAVKSMLSGWHPFLFASFDSGGFVSVDKPPVGLWVQTASARRLGLSAWSLLLPQALAGVCSVALLYSLVQRIFGVLAGLLAALALALTPISIVANRANLVDSLLVLTVLLGAWAISRAAETGQVRWLLLCAALVGLGFNIKMLQAYLVVPAFAFVYLFAAPHRWRVRVGQLALAGVVLIAVSFSWAAGVDLIPASQRPYVGSSTANSELQLALGYNGLDRLLGFTGLGRRTTGVSDPLSAFAHGFTASETGAPGPLRLVNQQLGGQASWLLPLAVIGLLALCWRLGPRRPPGGWRTWRPGRWNREQQGVALWGLWLLTQGVFFSVARFFHAYYLVMLAPAMCALVGIGVVELWSDFRRHGWQGWLLPAALVLTALVQVHLLSAVPGWNAWLVPLLLALCLVCASTLAIVRMVDRHHLLARLERLTSPVSVSVGEGPLRRLPAGQAFCAVLAALGLFALLLAPTTWSIASMERSTGLLPTAGPPRQSDLFAEVASTHVRVDPKLVAYLEAHQDHVRFLVATLNALQAAPLMLDTDQPVMALGGFAGGDPILTPDRLAKLVKQGAVRFFLLPSNPFQDLSPAQLAKLPAELRAVLRVFEGAPGRSGFNADLTNWVARHCTTVPPSQWNSTGKKPGSAPGISRGRLPIPGFGDSMAEKLFDCG